MSTSATPIQADPKFLVDTIFIWYARCLIKCYSNFCSASCDAFRPCDASSYTVEEDIMAWERRRMLFVAWYVGHAILNHAHIELGGAFLALLDLTYLLYALHDPPSDSLDSLASISP